MKTIKSIFYFLGEFSFCVLLTIITVYTKSYHNLYMEGVSDPEYVFWGYNPQNAFASIMTNILVLVLTLATLIFYLNFAAKYWRPLPSRN